MNNLQSTQSKWVNWYLCLQPFICFSTGRPRQQNEIYEGINGLFDSKEEALIDNAKDRVRKDHAQLNGYAIHYATLPFGERP